MAQQEVYDLLKKARSWKLTSEIVKELGITSANVSQACRKMLKNKEIEYREVVVVLKIKNGNRKYRAKEWRLK